MRNTWVSTANAGMPKALDKTTLAVFRPTPGRFSSEARSRGTVPWWCFVNNRQVAKIFFALLW